jgi:hypothetical protein
VKWDESYVLANGSSGEAKKSIIPPSVIPTDGQYSIKIDQMVVPSRLELMLEYDNDDLTWIPIDFYMAHYSYSANKVYQLPVAGSTSIIRFTMNRVYDVYVDAEKNQSAEKNRALNVLRNK